jgi:hypothetical protein
MIILGVRSLMLRETAGLNRGAVRGFQKFRKRDRYTMYCEV